MFCGNAAPAVNSTFIRLKKRSRKASSASSARISMSYPRGTLKWIVEATSRRLAIVRSKRPGSGRPLSMYRVPPLASTILKL